MGEGQERVQGVERGEVVVDDAGEEVRGGGRGGYTADVWWFLFIYSTLILHIFYFLDCIFDNLKFMIYEIYSVFV